MDRRQEEQHSAIRHPNELFQNIEVGKTCPKCQSYFVTEQACESCGYQLKFDLMANHLSGRVFYSLKEDFEGSCPRWVSFLPKKLRVKRVDCLRYKKRLLRRFDDLITVLTFDDERDSKALLESKQIIYEYLSLGGEGSHLYLYIEGKGLTSLENEINKFSSDELSSWPVNQKTFVLRLIAGVSIVVLISYYFLLYLIKSIY